MTIPQFGTNSMNIAKYPSEVSWSDQLRTLELQLRADPDSTWLIQVRIKTLKFLISRYGDHLANTDLPPVPSGNPYYGTARPKWAPGTVKDPGKMLEVLHRIRERLRM